MTDAAVTLDGLSKRYGATTAVDGLSFEIGRGEVFGLLGPNGAGKTTTVEVLEGYRRADGGAVSVLGLDPWRDGDALHPRVGVMLQEGGLYPGLRAPELLRLFASYYDDPEDPDALLALVGLEEKRRTPVRRLSGGEKQRLSLALALVGRPELVFLDEPTAGMDPHARAVTWSSVRALRDRGVTIVLTTHAMDEAEQLCDRLAIIDRGRLVASGTPAELTRPRTDEIRFWVADPLDTDGVAVALGLPASSVRALGAGEHVVDAPVSSALVAAITQHLDAVGVLCTELRAGRRSLEDVFLRLTGAPGHPAEGDA